MEHEQRFRLGHSWITEYSKPPVMKMRNSLTMTTRKPLWRACWEEHEQFAAKLRYLLQKVDKLAASAKVTFVKAARLQYRPNSSHAARS